MKWKANRSITKRRQLNVPMASRVSNGKSVILVCIQKTEGML